MSGELILVVDDNAASAKLIRFLLAKHGYEVVCAASAREALDVLARTTPDLVLMDVSLPDADGLELTRRLKADARTTSVPVVAVTAAATKDDEAAAYDAGCVGYLTKPIDTSTFERTIRARLDGREIEARSAE